MVKREIIMRTPEIQSSGKRLVWALACLLTSTGLLAAQDTDPNAASIKFTQPQLNNTYTGTVPVSVQIGMPFDPATFQAELNGTDITKLFSLVCAAATTCDEKAQLPEADMLPGTNVLVADIGGPNESVGTARVKFEYSSPNTSNAPVEKLVPGVGVSASALPYDADPKATASYSIVLGPGPGFPRVEYSAKDLGCANINSMQVLVLGRKTLVPDTRVGGGTGRGCFGDAGSLSNFFKSIPEGDLVIANSFLGLMPNLNTTAIGGTDYTKAQVSPWYYNAIGVAGAPTGTAYESYQPIHQLGIDYLPALQGSLMLDIHQNYFFTPSDFREIKVIPVDPAYPDQRTSSINYFGVYPFTLPAGVSGGFRVFMIDRQKGYVQENNFFPTNSNNPQQVAQAMQDLLYTLQGSTPQYLMIFSSVGTPFASSTQPSAALFSAWNAAGGNGYMLQKMIPLPNGDAIRYTLITCTDPEYVKAGYAVENFSLWNSQLQTGEVHAFLARDRKNRIYVKTALSDIPKVDGISSELGWAWEKVSFQQPQDWPAWTSGQQKAYEDLTSSKNTYPSVTNRLGCGTFCQPIRAYYDGGVGGTGGSDLNVLKINWENVVYQANPDYTAEDFRAVVNQLSTEQGYLSNVYTLYSLFRALTYESNDNLASQLSKVAAQLDSSLQAPQNNPLVSIDTLEKASAVTKLLSALPAVGPAFGAVSAILGGVAGLVPPPNGTVPDGQYAVTYNELVGKNQTFATNLANTTDVMFTGFTNDWGKLQIIGGGYGGHQSPWYMCQTCSNAQPPRTALPAIALGAKRQFYSQLMGKAYSLDSFVEILGSIGTPRLFGSVYNSVGFKYCHHFYTGLNDGSWLMYPSFNKPSTNDMLIVTQTQKGSDSTYGAQLYFPSTNLLNDLFGAPTVVNGFLSGGAGFIPDQFFFSQYSTPTPPRVLTLRPGQTIPGQPLCGNGYPKP
jgi:hypothetical protein